MKTFREFVRDAERYRALKSTEQAAPWKDVLGGQPNLDSLADALVTIVNTKDTGAIHEEGEGGVPANNSAATPGIAKYDPLLGSKKLKARRTQPQTVGSIVRIPGTPSHG